MGDSSSESVGVGAPDHPYRIEIIATFVIAPLVIAIETWRRWGNLLHPTAMDDYLVFGGAMFVAWRLARRDPLAPRLWLFVCGGAWFIVVLSTWGSASSFDEPDPSGAPVAVVLAFKVVGLVLISIASWRAVRRLG